MKHDTLDDLKQSLIDELDTIIKANQLSGKPNKQINENDFTRAIIKACDVIFIDYSTEQNMRNYTYGIYNPEVMGYVRNTNFLGELIQTMINSLNTSPNITVKKATGTVDYAIMMHKGSHHVRKANIPPKHIIKFKNTIIDLKTKIKYNGNDDLVKNYDFIDSLRYDLKNIDDVNQDMLEIVKTIFNLWSQNNEDMKLLIMQLFFSYIEGDGKNKYIILQSEGGDGKSTAMRMIQKIGDPELTKYINLNDLKDDNVLNQVQPSTRFFFGDDLVSNFKMSSKDLARFKTLVDGGSINVSEKYMPNKLISCQGLKVQATNTEIKFYENNDAIKDRIIYIKWPHYNFRKEPIKDFNLDQLSGKYGKANTDFMEALIAYIIENVEYFNQFNITEKMIKDFNEVLDANDVVKMQVKELYENNLLNFKYLPYNVLYEHYKQWLNINNPGSKPIKSTEYIKKVAKIFEDYNIVRFKTPKKLKQLTKSDFNIDDFEGIYVDDNKQTKLFINNNLNIDYDELNNNIKNIPINELLSKYTHDQLNQYISYLINNYPSDAIDLSNNLKIKVNELHDYDIKLLLEELKKLF